MSPGPVLDRIRIIQVRLTAPQARLLWRAAAASWPEFRDDESDELFVATSELQDALKRQGLEPATEGTP